MRFTAALAGAGLLLAGLDGVTPREYATANAAGYYSYFGARAGDPEKGYYSFTENGWKLIFLNSNCGKIADKCTYSSVQAPVAGAGDVRDRCG